MRLWNEAGACLKRSENPGALWDGILAMNCKNSLKVVTGSSIVSPLAIVRKSNIPALSRKVLSLVLCRVLRKFVGSVLKQVSLSQKCSMLRVGRFCSEVVLLVMVDIGMGPVLPQSGQMGGKRSFERKFRFLLVDFSPSTARCHR